MTDNIGGNGIVTHGTLSSGADSSRRLRAAGTGSVPLEVVRRISLVAARINAGDRLDDTLQAVADGVVEALGFGAAAINFRRIDGDFEVVAVSGPPDAREALLDHVVPGAVMSAQLEHAEIWGHALRFVRHDSGRVLAQHAWAPEPTAVVVDDPGLDESEVWHPRDSLAAVLQATDGRMVGVLSVDLPPGGRIPTPETRELLELFSLQAGIAIDNARVSELHASRNAELQEENSQVRASETAFRSAFEDSAGAMAMIDPSDGAQGRVMKINPAMARLLQLDDVDIDGTSWSEVLHPDDLDAVRDTIDDLVAGRRREHRRQGRLLRADGRELWASFAVTVVDPPDGQPTFLLVQLEDLTERREEEELWRHRADHDELTGLLRRRVLVARIARTIERVRAGGRPAAVLFCDLDDFKPVNDTLGHAAGDRVLQEVARRLLDMLRSRDSVARLGGDEFVVLAEDLHADELATLRDRIRLELTRPLTTVPAAVGVSIGLQVIDGTTDDAEEILTRADASMYGDKQGRHTR